MKADFQKAGIHIWIRQMTEALELISVAQNHFPDLPESKGNYLESEPFSIPISYSPGIQTIGA